MAALGHRCGVLILMLLQSHLYIDEKQRHGVTLNNGATRHNGLTKSTEPKWATSFGVVSQ